MNRLNKILITISRINQLLVEEKVKENEEVFSSFRD